MTISSLSLHSYVSETCFYLSVGRSGTARLTTFVCQDLATIPTLVTPTLTRSPGRCWPLSNWSRSTIGKTFTTWCWPLAVLTPSSSSWLSSFSAPFISSISCWPSLPCRTTTKPDPTIRYVLYCIRPFLCFVCVLKCLWLFWNDLHVTPTGENENVDRLPWRIDIQFRSW